MKRVLLAAAAALLGLAIAWNPIVEPLLVRYPTNVDETLEYEGTFTQYVDAASASILETPRTLPLRVSRRVAVVDSSFDEVVIGEWITLRIGDDPPMVERHQYVMDRRSMAFVDDPRSWSYAPEFRVDRSGTHRVNLPLDTRADGRYPMWDNEAATRVWMDPRATRSTVAGLDVLRFRTTSEDPAFEGYLQRLEEQGLPRTIRLPGVDRDIPLRYRYGYEDHPAIEPTTGAPVAIHSDEWVTAAPDPEVMAELGFPAMEPVRVFAASFDQTPASVAETVDEVRAQLDTIRLVRSRIPLALVVVGLLAAALAVRPSLRRLGRRSAVRPRRAGPAPA